MPSAIPTANDVVKAVDELRPALEEAAKTCRDNSDAPALAAETLDLVLQPVQELPTKLSRERMSAESSRSATSVDYEALVTTVEGCKRNTEKFARELERKDKPAMLLSLKEIVNGVLSFVQDASLGFNNQDMITSLNEKAEELERLIGEGDQQTTSEFHNHSTGKQYARSGSGDQNIHNGRGHVFTKAVHGPVSFSGEATQTKGDNTKHYHYARRRSQPRRKRNGSTESPDSASDEDD
ncbi:hypothetical protein B0T20DRAFT_444227 [Sordaria brevicollis]|uniref:NACHT-NTPase and P-loop NTPases N-terminal domain-containing protein n=1 Tax=Sordaria brevicollis TaxID=83679 RepID=A0AAE0P2J2_SORBR|nr:hypothetical protein B0T20DRAFT_444227 [Sordaria brevicollis]